MTTSSSDGHREFAAVLRRFFSSEDLVARARASLDAPDAARDLWERQQAQLELGGLALPEDVGGQGYGLAELVIACQEAGRVLAGGPFFPTACLAAPILQRAVATDHRERGLKCIAMGETFAVAVREPGSTTDAASVRLQATQHPTGPRLSGRKMDVLGSSEADRLLVIARQPSAALAVYAVDPRAAGVKFRPAGSLDATRPLTDLTLHDAPGECLSGQDDISPELDQALDVARLCLAAEAVGAADRCMERTVGYLKTRYQFGQQIGAFQALQHRAVDVMVSLELARHGLAHATTSLAQQDDAPVAVSLALAAVLDAFHRAASEEIQLHGGMGVAWESDAHLYFRRAAQSQTLLGTSTWHRKRIACNIAGLNRGQPT